MNTTTTPSTAHRRARRRRPMAAGAGAPGLSVVAGGAPFRWLPAARSPLAPRPDPHSRHP